MDNQIIPYIWQIGDEGRTAVVLCSNGQSHVLVACDTYNSVAEAVARMAAIEEYAALGLPDRPAWLKELVDAADLALEVLRVDFPLFAQRLDDALQKAR